MTDEFDFDFDVDRGRSASRTEGREQDQQAPGNGDGRELPEPDYRETRERKDDDVGNGRARRKRTNGDGNGNGRGNGSRRFTQPPPPGSPRAKPPEQDDGDWLSFGDDDFTPGARSPLSERDDGPAGPPTPGEARNFAKEARRRASRRPSPILDLDIERERLEKDQDAEDVDFESVLERQPQKSGVARRGSALRNAVAGGMESLRRVGGERIADSRDRVQALRERVPSSISQPRPATAGGDGKPPPPRLPRRISSRRPRKPKPGRIKKLRLLIILAGLGLLAIVSTFFGMMMAISQDLPQLENKKEFAEAKNSVVVDDQGNKIGTLLNNNNRQLLSSDQISPYMKQAAVAIEDRRFYEHNGVDIQGMARAGLQDLLPGGSTQGASTITEQFVKNALEAQGSRTVFEKFREAALAYHLERQWTKDKILTEYLNTIYFGEGAYGIEAAAHTYFGKQHPGCGQGDNDPCAKELTPPEAAMLAGIIASPSAFSPRINPLAATDRRNLVLSNMLDQGDITEQEYNTGIATQVPVPSDIERPQDDSLSPYYTSWLRQQVVDLYGAGRAFGGGYQIHSSLDLDMQNTAQDIAESTLSGIAPTASVVVLDNATGEVKAMVGGNDFENHPFNLATNGHRQPGSSFKPFTLATALSQGISPGTSYPSNEKFFRVPHGGGEVFDVHNYGDEYYGSSSLETATIHSDNSVYAELALHHTLRCQGCSTSPSIRGGTKRIARTAHQMGIETKFSTNPSMVLGAIDPGVTPLEMAHAYETIATGGERVGGNLDSTVGPNNTVSDLGPVAIDKVTAPNGDTVAENKTKKIRVLSESVANTMKGILHLNVLEGTGKLAQFGDSAEWGKTGTTENNGDAWFCGGTEHMTACVWVGHADTNTPMTSEFNGGPVDGGTFPAEIWGRIMSALEQIYSDHKAAANDKGGGSSTTSDSGGGSGYVPPSSSSGSSGYSAPSSSSGTGGGGGGGGNTGAPAGGGGGGGAGGGGGGATGGTGGTGGTGL
jgi:penicillin-binding protein 1A